ncbi:hypothetical protein OEZ85_002737 [Tetradesmus obliquus]|uniref:Uncharacterized protein n=1 Tax=Tetradesmus obliquus TaxID=3088 RepID=A0ABY8U0P3_TETOB|nr:hypothetical protein OEZ85_002737 [Tetradesmus obliquus]
MHDQATGARCFSLLPYSEVLQTSAFFAAAAGGHSAVLSQLVAAGGLSWACQLPGDSLPSVALDLAAQGGHLAVLQLLHEKVRIPSSSFLTAAADSGRADVVEWGLGLWMGQFNAVRRFGPGHIAQMHDALRVSCESGHLGAIRALLRYLHAVRCHDCCVLALSYTCASSNSAALRCVLGSPYLPQQLERGGPKLLEQLVMVAASCLRIAIRTHNTPSLQLLLDALQPDATPAAPLAAVRPLLAPQMPSVFDQAASAGNTLALQLLLTRLPEHCCCLGLSALEAALAEGHSAVAGTIRLLLLLRGPAEGFSLEALSVQHNAAVGRAARHGALKAAASRGDVAALQQLLGLAGGGGGAEVEGAAGAGPDDNQQLLMLRLAAAGGRVEAVALLLAAFGGGQGGPRCEPCLRAVLRGAVHAGQVALLQALEAECPAALQAHLAQPDSLAEYLRAALLCGQVDTATWLLGVAGRQQQLDVVAGTLVSLLTTSRWELWNTGVGRTARDAAAALLKALAATTPPQAAPTPAPAAAPAADTAAPAAELAAAAAAAAGSGELEQQQQQQQQQGEASSPCLRRESQPPQGCRQRTPQPLRTALSVPLPAKTDSSSRQAPLHPYMQYYQQQAHQQQQRQRQQQQQQPRPQEMQAAQS